MQLGDESGVEVELQHGRTDGHTDVEQLASAHHETLVDARARMAGCTDSDSDEPRHQAPATAPIPAPVDSGTIGRLTEGERYAIEVALCALTGVPAPKVVSDLSGVPTPLDAIIAAIVRAHVTAALAEVEARIEHGPHRLGHNVSVVCSCVRCEATHACLTIVRAARQEQGR